MSNNPFEDGGGGPSSGGTNPFDDDKGGPDESWAKSAVANGGDGNDVPLLTETGEPAWADDKKDASAASGVAKRGHIFFGYCCDSRRAVIITSLLDLVLHVVGFISAAVPDDGVTVSAPTVVTMVFQVFFTLVILYGGYKFVPLCVLIGLLWELFTLCYWIAASATTVRQYDWSAALPEQRGGTIAFIVISILWQVFFVIYAGAAFVWDSYKGYMDPTTYSVREKQSCFCA